MNKQKKFETNTWDRGCWQTPGYGVNMVYCGLITNISLMACNNTDQVTDTVWCMVTVLKGSPYNLLKGPANILSGPCFSQNRDRTQQVRLETDTASCSADSSFHAPAIWSTDQRGIIKPGKPRSMGAILTRGLVG